MRRATEATSAASALRQSRVRAYSECEAVSDPEASTLNSVSAAGEAAERLVDLRSARRPIKQITNVNNVTARTTRTFDETCMTTTPCPIPVLRMTPAMNRT